MGVCEIATDQKPNNLKEDYDSDCDDDNDDDSLINNTTGWLT